MKFLKQTRLHRGSEPHERGNCYPTVIACWLDLDSAEDVIQFQEYYHIRDPNDPNEWSGKINNWLKERGWWIWQINGHRFDDSYYMVTGVSPRNPDINHIVIYQNGKMVHGPHPDNTGVLNEFLFEILDRVE